jgi:hypothetical protein
LRAKLFVFMLLATIVSSSLLSSSFKVQLVSADEVLGDVDGNGKINIVDLALIAKAYGFGIGDLRYRSECDLNGDGSIGIVDLTIAARNFGKIIRLSYEGKIFSFQLPEVAVQVNAPGYSLPVDLADVAGYMQIKNWLGISQEQASFLSENGFVVLRTNSFESLSNFYFRSRYAGAQTMITTDAVLNTYHVLFDETLKRLEMNELADQINGTIKASLTEAQKTCEALTNTPLEEASRLNVMYVEVALALMQPSFEPTHDEALQELQLISQHSQITYSPIFKYKEDYSQYVPRGHYTENEQLKAYFKTMMWLGRMRFALLSNSVDNVVNVDQTRAALLLTMIVANNPIIYNSWLRVYEVTSFFVGASDDLTFGDYIAVLDENRIASMGQLYDQSMVEDVAQQLLNRNRAKILGTYAQVYWSLPQEQELQRILNETAGLRFMGQRFIPDSYIFQQLVFPQVGDFDLPRRFPKGLDVPGVLGSDLARDILSQTEAVYKNYDLQVESLEQQFHEIDVDNWTQNLYWSWLYTANSTLEKIPDDEKYPTYMTRPAWGYEKLQSFMGTWTELRHDTILYAKQSYTGFYSFPPDLNTVYVEPYPETYRRLIGLINMTINGLKVLNALPAEAEASMKSFMEISGLFLNASIIELEGSTLDASMREQITAATNELSRVVSMASAKTQGVAIAVDVHTDPNIPPSVLEEALGRFNVLVVIYADADGRLYAAAGPAYNYFEFIQPIDKRLTDEAWLEMLTNTPPEPPEWTNIFAK